MPLRRTRARVQGRGIPSATLCIPRKRKHAHNDTLSRARSRTHKDKGGDRLVLSKCEECETRPVTVTEEKHSPEKRLLMPRCHATPHHAAPHHARALDARPRDRSACRRRRGGASQECPGTSGMPAQKSGKESHCVRRPRAQLRLACSPLSSLPLFAFIFFLLSVCTNI